MTSSNQQQEIDIPGKPAQLFRDCWYIGASAEEVGQRPLARRICDAPVVFFRGSTGAIVALEDRCPHRKAPLSLGVVRDGELACGYHGLRLNEHGRCTWAPLQGKEPPRLSVHRYPIVERFGYAFIWMGTGVPEQRRELPPWVFMEQANWTDFRGYHHVLGDYRLVCDNLLDLTHLPFVHPDTLGRNIDTALYLSAQKTWTEGNVVHTYREAGSSTARPMDPPELIRDLPPGEALLRFQSSQFYLPSFVTVGFETARKEDPDSRLPTHFVVNGVTPESTTSCHYFWAVDHREDPAQAQFYRNYLELTIAAFNEDKAMIEAQQARIADDPDGRPLVDLGGDAASRLARGLVRRSVEPS